MEEKIIGEIIIRLLKRKKNKLIEMLIENLKGEGKIYLIKNIVEYLKVKNAEMKNQEISKLFLAFDYNEKDIEKYIKNKFKLNIKVTEKIINPNLILGGRLVTSNYLIDFSFKNLIAKMLSNKQWKI